MPLRSGRSSKSMQELVSLFDRDIIREVAWLRPMESSFDFLNRSARPQEGYVRRLLESWYRKYPTEGGQHLAIRERFRSDTVDHQAAFFELYCHALLRRQGYSIRLEPTMEGVSTHIDFLSSKGKKMARCFRLEAKVLSDSEEDRSIDRHLVSLRDGLNKIDSPQFRFRVAVLQGTRAPLPMKTIRRDVRKWLAELDSEAMASKPLSYYRRMRQHYGDWELSFTAKIRSEHEREYENVVSISRGGWRGNRDRVAQNLRDKASKYGKLDVPYIIALDVIAKHEQIDGVTGTLSSINVEPPFWAKCPQVSAVLAVNGLFPWSCARKMAILWHNPQPHLRLDLDLWQGPQRIWDDTSAQWKDIPGKPIWQLLGLTADWPDLEEVAKPHQPSAIIVR